VLPWACAEIIVVSFSDGTLADHLREHDFRWNFDEQMQAIADGLSDLLEQSDLGGRDDPQRADTLERVAQDMIRAALSAIDVPVPKDLFRDRRG
jgi:hypothetical protein